MSNRQDRGSACLGEKHVSIQCLLGKCLLRLQEYESLLKHMLPQAAVSGPASDIPASIAKKRSSLQKKMMGELVGTLTESFLTGEHADQEERTSSVQEDGNTIWVESRTQVVFSAERYVETKAGLKEVVALRNELVHHFIDKFDLSNAEGCADAQGFLEASYQSIDDHFTLLRAWNEAMIEAQVRIASVTTEPAFLDFLDGILPDGTVEWARAGIVQGLRDAEERLAVSGWTDLSEAIAWISKSCPEQTPKRFGCSSWRQALHESRQFEIRKEVADGAQLGAQAQPAMVVWFRSRRETL